MGLITVQVSTFHPTSYSPIFVYLLYIDLYPLFGRTPGPWINSGDWILGTRYIDQFSNFWISIKPGFWDIMAKEAHFLTVKYLTGYAQSLAVSTYTVDVVTAGLWAYPVKYFMLLRRCLCARTCWLLGVIEKFLNFNFFYGLIKGYGRIVKTSRFLRSKF